MGTDHRQGRPVIRWAAALLVVASISGCVLDKHDVVVPTSIGVVASVERVAGQILAYHLESGQVVQVDLATARVTPPGGARGGMLLLAGTEASGRPWLVALYPNTAVDAPPGCFRLEATGVGVGDSIDLSIGVRLRKAPNFDPGTATNDQYTTERRAFCVNANGEVTSYG